MDTLKLLFPINTAICSPLCGTNKECTAPDTCSCVSGWTGSNCETCMFTFSCRHVLLLFPLNTAIWISPYGIRKRCTTAGNCNCPLGWSGSDCEERMLTFCYGHIFILVPSQHSNLQSTLWYK